MARNDRKQPFRVGLTGGIASGKSTVADFFAELGVHIIDTDIIARDVVRPGTAALKEICGRFGDSVIDATGNLDRVILRKIVFASDDARRDLEAMLHPRIIADVLRQAESTVGPYQLIVVPLLVDSPLKKFVDRTIVVDCDEETQIQRLMQRDSESAEQAQKILDAQSSRQERLAIADYVIRNAQGLDQIRSQVIDLDRQFRHLAERCEHQ